MTRPLFARFSTLIALLAMLAGCAGYQVGNQALYPPHIQTVYVPVFQSESFRRNLGEQLTEAVVKEIEKTTPYKVVASPTADSVLTGAIVTERKHALTENKFDEPRHLETVMLVEVQWVDRSGAALMEPCALPLPPQMLFAQGRESFVPEAGQSVSTALNETIREVAAEVVGRMERRW